MIAIMLISGLTLLVAVSLGAWIAPSAGANPADMLSIGNKPCAEDQV